MLLFHTVGKNGFQSMTKRRQKPIKVSVIMNCLNCEKYVREAIDSVYAQTYPDWEIIFWDNASLDSSGEIAKSYDERLKYFRGDKTIPLGRARNLAIEKAKGEYIAFLDCDDMWLPKKLEKQMALFEKTPEPGIVYSNCMHLYLPSNQEQDLFSKAKPYKGDVLEKLFMQNFISMQTVVIKRDILDKCGGFGDNLKLCLDFDMWLRVSEIASVDYVDEVLARYRVHDGSFSRTNPTSDTLEEIVSVLNGCVERNPRLKRTIGKKAYRMFCSLYLSLAHAYLKQNIRRRSFYTLLKAFKEYRIDFPYDLHRALPFIRRMADFCGRN